jgi:radical SAM-linked protein
VPKPHTPFQWEAQIPLEEVKRRIGILLTAAKREKRIKLRWHVPEMSFLEGIFSRGDRRLASVIEKAYEKGAIFSSWIDRFNLNPWMEAMSEAGLDPLEYTGELKLNSALPWGHLHSGVNHDFLLRERERAFKEQITIDCRYAACHQCGVCDTQVGPSSLPKRRKNINFNNILNFKQRDQEAHSVKLDEHGRVITRNLSESSQYTHPALANNLTQKVAHYQVWYSKAGPATNLSQLELLAVFERAMRRGKLPLTFSHGFMPAPLLSFARALPVGVASQGEWFCLYLRENFQAQQVLDAFARLPVGLKVTTVRKLPLNQRPGEANSEQYHLKWTGSKKRLPDFERACAAFNALPELFWVKKGKKHDREINLRKLLHSLEQKTFGQYKLTFDWSGGYTSPLALTYAALGMAFNGNSEYFSAVEIQLTKLVQN